MFETPLTVVGNIVNEPVRRRVGDQEVIKLRVASNSRRRGADGTWETGNSLFINVNCWGRLVTGVGASLYKGSPVVAVGHVYTSEYDDRDGIRRSALEMRATAVGPDLSRCAARIEKIIAAGPEAIGSSASSAPSAPAAPAWESAAGEPSVAGCGGGDDADGRDGADDELQAEDGLGLSA